MHKAERYAILRVMTEPERIEERLPGTDGRHRGNGIRKNERNLWGKDMTKLEFLEGLEEALMDAPISIRQENLRYYSSYIDEQVAKGIPEESVMEELGEPNWIANSILEAAEGDTQADETTYEFSDTSRGEDFFRRAQEFRETAQEAREEGGKRFTAHFGGRSLEIQGWLAAVIGVAVLVLVLLVLGLIFGTVSRILIFLLTKPAFWLVAAALAVYGYFRMRR